jgi:6-phosphogluconolactonase
VGTRMNIKRFHSPSALFQFVTGHMLSVAKSKIKENNRFNVAVSGGSTPLPLFRAMATTAFPDWKKVNFFWVDERWVPIDHHENNYGEAKRAGLKKIPASFYPFDTSAKSPDEACRRYTEAFHDVLADRSLDLIVLGAGQDGHTASIFRYDLHQARQPQIAFVTRHPVTGQIRLSLTLTTIKKASEALIVIVGEEKRSLLEDNSTDKGSESPVQLVVAESLNVTIVTDLHE